LTQAQPDPRQPQPSHLSALRRRQVGAKTTLKQRKNNAKTIKKAGFPTEPRPMALKQR